MAHGEMGWFEIPADDVARATGFYSDLFGWQFQSMESGPPYEMVRSGPGDLGGAIGKRGESAPPTVRDYVTVDSIDDTLAKAERHGVGVITPRTEIPGGWFAVLKDTEGNDLGLYEVAPQAG